VLTLRDILTAAGVGATSSVTADQGDLDLTNSDYNTVRTSIMLRSVLLCSINLHRLHYRRHSKRLGAPTLSFLAGSPITSTPSGMFRHGWKLGYTASRDCSLLNVAGYLGLTSLHSCLIQIKTLLACFGLIMEPLVTSATLGTHDISILEQRSTSFLTSIGFSFCRRSATNAVIYFKSMTTGTPVYTELDAATSNSVCRVPMFVVHQAGR